MSINLRGRFLITCNFLGKFNKLLRKKGKRNPEKSYMSLHGVEGLKIDVIHELPPLSLALKLSGLDIKPATILLNAVPNSPSYCDVFFGFFTTACPQKKVFPWITGKFPFSSEDFLCGLIYSSQLSFNYRSPFKLKKRGFCRDILTYMIARHKI